MSIRRHLTTLLVSALLLSSGVPQAFANESAHSPEALLPLARLLYKISFCGSVAEHEGRHKRSESFLEINAELETAILKAGWSSSQLANSMQLVTREGFPELKPEPDETMREFARRHFTEKRCQSVLQDASSRIDAEIPSPEAKRIEREETGDSSS